MNPVAITLVVRLLVGVSTPSCGVAIHCILKHTVEVTQHSLLEIMLFESTVLGGQEFLVEDASQCVLECMGC
jgi:hypothetical protein